MRRPQGRTRETSGVERDADPLRQAILASGIKNLPVTDLYEDDLPGIEWSGSPLHLEYVRAALRRVPTGEVEYLCVRAPNGEIVSKGGINYSWLPGTGMLYQFATRENLMSLGIGTQLIRAAENRIKKRGLTKASLRVELANMRARALYERLGYRAVREVTSEWDQETPDGSIRRYVAHQVEMEKDL